MEWLEVGFDRLCKDFADVTQLNQIKSMWAIMKRKSWYESLKIMPTNYEKESFVQGTVGAYDFIERALNFYKSPGFSKIEIFGAKLGAFSRQDAPAPEDFEMLVVAGRNPS